MVQDLITHAKELKKKKVEEVEASGFAELAEALRLVQ